MPMNKAKKAEELKELQGMLTDVDAIIITENKGMSVQQVSELRRAAKAENAAYKVSKNSLSKIALKGTKFEGILDMFKGPTALIIAKDGLSAARVAHKFASTSNDKLQVVGGIMGDKRLDKKEIAYFATLPSLDALRGKLVGILQAPAAQIARVVDAYAKKGEA